MISLKSFTFNAFAENTYVLFTNEGQAVVVDPGMSSRLEDQEMLNFLEDTKLQLVGVVLTHAHIDHVLGCAFLVDRFKVPLTAHANAPQTLAMSVQAARMYGIAYDPSPEPTRIFGHGDVFHLGDDVLEVRFAPGHAPDHVVLIDHAGRKVIAGDVLFQGSVGRVDLPGGDADTLAASIQQQLYTLPEDYIVYCGHGGSTTIGAEMRSNPFVRPGYNGFAGR
jgi:glyoxylase-like metal-dependent hydrolase (beta-lactamase superfamily II)